MDYSIVHLTEKHLHDLKELFLACFYSDHYYSDMFNENKEKEFTKFNNLFSYCIKNKTVYGIFDSGRLISFLIYFDYNSTIGNKDIFHLIFGSSYKEKYYFEKINSYVTYSKTIYLLSIGIDEQFRRRGLATSMITNLIIDHNDSDIISNISNSASLPIYEARGFNMYPLDKGYTIVKLEHKKND